MIRIILGLLLVMGAVGGMEHDPSVSVILLTGVAIVGLTVMNSGVEAIRRL